MGRSQVVRQRFLVPPPLVRIQAPQPLPIYCCFSSAYLALENAKCYNLADGPRGLIGHLTPRRKSAPPVRRLEARRARQMIEQSTMTEIHPVRPHTWFSERPKAAYANKLGTVGSIVGMLVIFLNVGNVIGDLTALIFSVISGSMGFASLVVWWTDIRGMEEAPGWIVWLGGIMTLAIATLLIVGAVWIMRIWQ